MKKSFIASSFFGAALFALSSLQAATAVILVYDEDSAINPVPTANYPVSKVFSDDNATLTYIAFGIPINLTCRLTLYGEVDEGPVGVGQVSVTGGTVTGGGLCGTVVLSGFPWLSDSVPQSDLQVYGTGAPDPLSLRFYGIGVNLCSPSSGLYIDAEFSNNSPTGIEWGAPSSFNFTNAVLYASNGTPSNCSFNASLTPKGGDIDIYNSGK